MATYGGVDVFVRPFSTIHEINPSAQQLNDFFGMSGEQSLWGGYRGRIILISGMLFAADISTLNSMEAVWIAQRTGLCHDGIARELVDTRFRVWEQMLALDFKAEGPVRLSAEYGYHFRYRCSFKGLL